MSEKIIALWVLSHTEKEQEILEPILDHCIYISDMREINKEQS